MNPSKKPSSFIARHIGPRADQQAAMLKFLGIDSTEKLIENTLPSVIRMNAELNPEAIGEGLEEDEAIRHLRELAAKNEIWKSYLGMGYADCLTPAVIQRNILENPRWYTQYTPYQSEISQGRLEALLNYQTMITDLTGMEIANASLLDEATAAAEAMAMALAIKGSDQKRTLFVADHCHPQTIGVIRTRAEPLGIEVAVGKIEKFIGAPADPQLFGAIFQSPATDGSLPLLEVAIQKAKAADALAIVSADLLALTLLCSPGEMGADIVIGSAQRFGVPMGYGGPHAAYLSTKIAHQRQLPGRLVGVSKDADGKPAIRLALQTREQHIRRDRATSNICTAQVLLAIMASMYAVYHGPRGLKEIALRIHRRAKVLAKGLSQSGLGVGAHAFFDTVRVETGAEQVRTIQERAKKLRVQLRVLDEKTFSIALDETTTSKDVETLLEVFTGKAVDYAKIDAGLKDGMDPAFARTSEFLSHPVFNTHHSETEMLRYITKLQNRDLSLADSMIPLGSCTMKLNATAEMIPVTFPEFGKIHPFAPIEQAKGYQELIVRLERMLCEITGFQAVSLQPNAGSQGEYAGLLVIRKFHQSRGQGHRDVCLIPQSAHGTNPASAAMAGMKVVVVQCDSQGNIDVSDLRMKAKEHSANLSALMVTYPSTHGVFEESIREICDVVHENGGQVYMDGANMNAQVGLCRPGDFGPDVCHLNLHKTFCIPHGGGGPGMGPIGVRQHLQPFLPGHPVIKTGGAQAIGPVSAAPWGSASILPISYAYVLMMGVSGLKTATEVAILSANYVAKRLEPHFPVLFKGKNGFVAHECIVDLRQLKATSGVEVEDVAKRLMDYGFHAPTVSFPVAGTMMIEPTESESLPELDRFCEAMIQIRSEIKEIENGESDRKNNVLKNAPHTIERLARSEWPYPYSREKAVFPLNWVKDAKFWPSVARIDNVYGERNLVCSCPPIEAYS